MMRPDARRIQDDADTGFTLVELLVVVAVSSFLISALVGALLLSFRVLTGLDEKTPGVPGLQNVDVVNAQLDASTSFPVFMRRISSDLADASAGDVSLANTPPCTDPSADPSLPTSTVLVSAITTPTTGPQRRVSYEYSADTPRHIARIVRYECALDASGTAAQIVASGLSSTSFASATSPSAGLVSVTLYTVTGRRYVIDAATHIPGVGSVTPPTGQALTSLTAQDQNKDGQIDRLVAVFGAASPQPECKTANAWSITPVGTASVSATAWSGSTATLSIANAANGDTGVGALSVSYQPPSGCNALLAVTSATPVDAAPPVLMSMTPGPAAGSSDGFMAAGDVLLFHFSEPIKSTSFPASGKLIVDLTSTKFAVLDPAVVGPLNLTSAPVLTNGSYFTTSTGLEHVMWAATVTVLASDPRTVQVTLDPGGCTLTCSVLQNSTTSPSPSPPVGNLVSITPASTIVGLDNAGAVANAVTPAPAANYRLF